MHRQSSAGGAAAMSGFGAAFMYSSTFGVPLDRASRPRPPRREKQAERPNSASQARQTPQAVARRPSRHSRSSSGSQASRSSQETGPLAAAAVASPPTAAAVGHRDSYSQPPAPRKTFSSTINNLSPRPSSRAAKALSRMHLTRPKDGGSSALDPRNGSSCVDQDTSKPSGVRQMSGLLNRAESISSTSGNTSISSRTMTSTDPSAAGDNHFATRPFVQRNGRTYLNDVNLPYPLPTDLAELHRQTLRTLLLIQVFGAPTCSPSMIKKPPQRVLEVGCGSGFWSMMCHQYFKSRGHSGISFTGIDIAPLAPDSNASMAGDATKPDHDMKWKFVQHDLRHMPWPLPSEEFDLIMVKDISLATPNKQYQSFTDEHIRLLRPGGTLEVWESDHLIRMLRPHVPGSTVTTEDAEDQHAASNLGAYVINTNTPFSSPLNTYLVEYNNWLSRALLSRDLSPIPCTLIGPVFLQESELIDVRTRRLAIPLSEVRWEREGVGGVITKDGKTHAEPKEKEPPPTPKMGKKTLTAGQIALRQTALLTLVQQAQALEPILRETSGKSQDESDVWLNKMMGDLMSEGGTSWGECLEIGAWCAKKKSAP